MLNFIKKVLQIFFLSLSFSSCESCNNDKSGKPIKIKPHKNFQKQLKDKMQKSLNPEKIKKYQKNNSTGDVSFDGKTFKKEDKDISEKYSFLQGLIKARKEKLKIGGIIKKDISLDGIKSKKMNNFSENDIFYILKELKNSFTDPDYYENLLKKDNKNIEEKLDIITTPFALLQTIKEQLNSEEEKKKSYNPFINGIFDILGSENLVPTILQIFKEEANHHRESFDFTNAQFIDMASDLFSNFFQEIGAF